MTSGSGSFQDTAVRRNSEFILSRYSIRNERLTFNYTAVPNNEDQFGEITGKTWIPFQVSPLYNVTYSEQRMKQYRKWLREQLTRQLPDTNKDTEYETNFTIISNLKETEDEPDSIKVDVIAKVTGKESSIYTGILLSHGNQNLINTEHFTSLPILICRGRKSVINIIHLLLQRLFDCYIRPFKISQEDFLWLGTIFCANIEMKKHANTNLCYQENKNIIAITIPLNYLHKLWKKISRNPEEIYSEEVTMLFKSLENHVLETFGVDLARTKLVDITLPHFKINIGGQFRSLTNNSTLHLLRYFNDLAINFHSNIKFV